MIAFVYDAPGKAKRLIVQVKSDYVKVGHVRGLVGTLDREKAVMGIFITLEEPTAPMRVEAVRAGYYRSPGWQQDYPRVQILTVQELLDGAVVKMPPTSTTFKQADRVDQQDDSQMGFKF